MTDREDLTAALVAADVLPAAWSAAFTAVDRAAFVPARCWFDDEYGRPEPIDRASDPDRWNAAVYSDEPVVTQLDDGNIRWPATSRRVTSSASQPSMVMAMLDALDVRDGDQVLEIGTGTGYNAGLLAARLGDDAVTTIEVDPVLADTARASLDAAGYKPTVVAGDGAVGWPARGPYDRIIATASVAAGRVPHEWVRQTRPGGLILTPWGTTYDDGVLVRLTTGDDGATGGVVGGAVFMRLRDHDKPFGHAGRLSQVIDTTSTAVETTTTVAPGEVATDTDGLFAVGLHLPGVQRSIAYDDPQRYEVLLYQVPSDSAATVTVTPEHAAVGRYPVRQIGPRALWTEAEAAHAWWVAQGRPVRTRFGVTVTAERENVWLDTPDNVIRRLR